MIRTVIRHSQRFAGLMLLAALTVTAAPAQPQNKKAVFVKQPATRDIKIQPSEIARKPVERVLETNKGPARRATGQPGEQKGIAVGEPNGGIRRKVEEKKDVSKKVLKEEAGGLRRIEDPANFPKKLKEASDGPQRQRGDQGPLTPVTGVPQKAIEKGEAGGLKCRGCKEEKLATPSGISPKVELKKDSATSVVKEADDLKKLKEVRGGEQGRGDLVDVPQRTKDAIGSPQRADQKSEGTVIDRKPKEDAVELLKKKKAIAKVEKIKTKTKRAEEEAPSLIRRKR